MADNKKGFMLYADLIHTISKMPDDKAGQLFKIILEYVNDKNPIIDDLVIDLVFEPIKQQLKRDLKKWETKADKSRENGKLGGRPKKTQQVKKETQKTQQVNSKPKKPVIVNVNVNDNVTVKDIYIDIESTNDLFLEYLEMRKKKKYTITDTVIKRLVKKLHDYSSKGHFMNDVIENAIVGGWKDFYEPKQEHKKSFQQQEQDKTKQIGTAVMNGFDPFDPRNYQTEEEVIDVRIQS